MVLLLSIACTNTTPLEQNVTSKENYLESLTHNVSALRRDKVPVEDLGLNDNQESAFMSSLPQKMDLLERNVTALKFQHDKDQLVIQNLQNDKDILAQEVNIIRQNMVDMKIQHDKDQLTMDNLVHDRDILLEKVNNLESNNSMLKLLYEENLQQLLTLNASHDNLQKEMRQLSLAVVDEHTEVARIQTLNNDTWTKISQRMDKMNVVLGGNISMVENKLEKYIETGMYICS